MGTLTYSVRWSREDKWWVATSDAWPHLSGVGLLPQTALQALIDLIDDALQEQSH